MRWTQSFTVLLLVLAALAAGVGVLDLRMSRAHHAGAARAVQSGLEHALDEVVRDLENRSPQGSVEVTTSFLSDAMLDKAGKVRFLPSFVAPRDVLLATDRIKVPSDSLILVVRFDGHNCIGIAANRKVRVLELEELNDWPHRVLSVDSLAPL